MRSCDYANGNSGTCSLKVFEILIKKYRCIVKTEYVYVEKKIDVT